MKGGQVLGTYPDDITDQGPLTLGRGKPSNLCNRAKSSDCES